MKKVFFILLVLHCLSHVFSQSTITIHLAAEIKKTPDKTDDFGYQQPLNLLFSVEEFNTKTITFYTGNDQKITEGKFGDEISKDQENTSVFKISISGSKLVGVGDDVPLPADSFYFKIGNDKSKMIRFERSEGGNKNATPSAYSGLVWKDALALNNPGSSSNVKAAILNHYGIYTTSELQTNYFLDDAIGKVFNEQKTDIIAKDLGSAHSGLGSNLLGLDVTTLADGVARFLVKRTKEELSIAFFDKFAKELTRHEDLRDMFPATYNLFQAIGTEIYNFNSYINNLREAFRSDLQSLDEHLPALINNHPEIFNENEGLKIALLTGSYVSVSVRDGMHPGDILAGYPIENFSDAKTEDMKLLKGAFQTLQLLSESLQSDLNSTALYWITPDRMKELTSDPSVMKIYLGLLAQRSKTHYGTIPFNKSYTLYGLLNNQELVSRFNTDYPSYKNYFTELYTRFKNLTEITQKYRSNIPDSVKVEYFSRYAKETARLIEHCTSIGKLPALGKMDELKSLPTKTEVYFQITYELCDLVVSINRKEYAKAVNHAIVIYNKTVKSPSLTNKLVIKDIKGSKKTEVLSDLQKSSQTTPDKSISEFVKDNSAIKEATSQSEVSDETGAILVAMARYGAFMANIVKAKTSEEIAEAIEAGALPAGSSRIKRETRFNVSLNSFVGLHWGDEKLKQPLNSSITPGWGRIYGLSAPIGIAVSKGLGKSKSYGSLSLFASVIDIGALASFRFQDDETEELPTVRLQNILAPGVHLVYGIPKTPLSIGYGWQKGPQLRKVNVPDPNNPGGFVNELANGYRWTVFIAVDIPLLNFYSKTK